MLERCLGCECHSALFTIVIVKKRKQKENKKNIYIFVKSVGEIGESRKRIRMNSVCEIVKIRADFDRSLFERTDTLKMIDARFAVELITNS